MTVKAQSKRRPVEKPAAAPTQFKRIDLGFLKLARRREIPIRRGTEEVKVELTLPVWGVIGWRCGSRMRLRGIAVSPWVESSVSSERGNYALDILREAQWSNEQVLTRIFRDRGSVSSFGLIAECPTPPAEILSAVDLVSGKFNEIFIAFEADWREDVSVPLDPLVIGVNKLGAFLLAVYDPTKLEHYIASEFTTL